MRFRKATSISIPIGIGGVLLVLIGLSFRPVQDRESATIPEAGRSPSGGTVSPVVSVLSGDSFQSRVAPRTRRLPSETTATDLPPGVAYQLSVIDEAVAGAGTNFVNTLPENCAERFWLIGNLMLEEIYQEQFRGGGPENIQSNQARIQLSRYLKTGRELEK